jgi:hypothetical protein
MRNVNDPVYKTPVHDEVPAQFGVPFPGGLSNDKWKECLDSGRNDCNIFVQPVEETTKRLQAQYESDNNKYINARGAVKGWVNAIWPSPGS